MDYDQLLERYNSYFGMEMKDAYYLNEYTHTLPWATCVIYVLMVFYLPKLLKKDEKKEEKKEEAAPAKEGEKKHRAKPKLTLISYVMAFWNLFLSVLSLAMLLGVGIPFWRIMYNKGLFDGLCDEGGVFWEQKDPMLYWAYIFALSKYAELIDTLFLIIKHPERPVPFLHWYHHWTVLLFTWYSVHNRFGTGGAFLTVNAFVHTVMYFYYFLKELNYDPTIIALPITIIQISQMVLGIYFVSVWTYMHYKVNGNCTCNNREIILASCVVMYGSYLFLFCKYFYYRYICGIMPGKSKPEGAAPSPAKKTQKAD